MRSAGFALRRPLLLLRDLLVNRDRPDLARLAAIRDPERFVWAILPHAARTFSACIALLPARSAPAAAVAYLYCRMLDTYEDLLPDAGEREAALLALSRRLPADAGAVEVPPPPAIARSVEKDQRDRAHLLLVRRCGLVDRAFLRLEPGVRPIIADVVRDMALGMREYSRTFREQGGVLAGEEQVAGYCEAVMGNPVVFTIRLLNYHRTGDPDLDARARRDALRVGEMVQLANITRDIEKDLLRGIAYDAALKDDLGRRADGDAELTERVRAARARLVVMALTRAPAYQGLIDAVGPEGAGVARASALLMLLFTDLHYRKYGRRAGLPLPASRAGPARLIFRSLPAAWSRSYARRLCREVESDFLAAAGRQSSRETS